MTRDAELVGRERERALFDAHLDGLAEGRGALVLVTGEAGIGKSRLLDAFGAAARARGFGVFVGRASETGGAPALWPWREILRGLFRHHGRDAFVRAAGASLPLIARLVPGLSDVPILMEIESAAIRFQLFDAVTLLLLGLAPIVMLLDDLHATDHGSLQLLQHATPSLVQGGVIVVGSARPEDAERDPESARVLWRLAREGTRLPLTRLSRPEIERVLASVLGRAPTDEEVRVVERTTEGSPLFVHEYGRLLGASGSLPPSLPPLVRHAIDARIERLPESTRAALEAISVLGRELETRLVSALGVPDAALAPGVTAGLLTTSPRGWTFSHILIRDALYARLSAEDRAARHERVADALATLGRSSVEVAHHALQAGERIASLRFLETISAAVTDLSRVGAFDDAARLAERAAVARALDEAARAELLALGGSALLRGGHAAEGRRRCFEASAIARRLGDDTLFARAALHAGADFTPGNVDADLVRVLEVAAALPLGDRALAARVRARLAASMQPARDPTEPVRIAHEAIAIAREVGDPGVLLDVLASATSALQYFDLPATREALDSELLALSERAGDRLLVLRTRVRLLFDALDAGDLARAEAQYDPLVDLARDLGQPRHVSHVALVGATLAAARGDLAEATRLHERARVAQGADDVLWQRRSLHHRLGRACMEHDGATLAALAPEIEPAFVSDWFVMREVCVAMLARVHAILGDRARALEYVRRLPLGSWAETREMITMGWLVEPFLLEGDAHRIRSLYEHLRPYATWHLTSGPPFPTYDGPYARHLARLASALGDPAADGWFMTAIAACRRAGAHPALCRVLVEAAEHHARAASFGDTTVRLLANEGLALASRLGLVTLAERARALATPEAVEPLAQPPAPTAPPTPTRPALERDGDLWRLTFGGACMHFKDSRGLQMLAALLAEPGREIAALVLDRADQGAPPVVSGGLAALDEAAVRAYRRRLAALNEDLADAEERGDDGRAERIREEQEALRAELARGLGLGGRARQVAGSAERARVNVQRRIKSAIERIALSLPEAGRYLERTVRTGALCVYDPL